jgi:hypothetical protein
VAGEICARSDPGRARRHPAFAALAIVTALIALAVKYSSSRADTRAMPQADEKIRLLRELQLRRGLANVGTKTVYVGPVTFTSM